MAQRALYLHLNRHCAICAALLGAASEDRATEWTFQRSCWGPGHQHRTRFLASAEAPITEEWKKALLAADSDETVKLDIWHDVFPPAVEAYYVAPRMLHSPFARQWEGRREDPRQHAKQLQDQIIDAIGAGKLGELLPFAGQTVGLIREILPAAEISRQIAAEAEVVLRRSMKHLA